MGVPTGDRRRLTPPAPPTRDHGRTAVPEDPEPGELADPYDERDWDVDRDGRMLAHADDPEPATIPWE